MLGIIKKVSLKNRKQKILTDSEKTDNNKVDFAKIQATSKNIFWFWRISRAER